MTPAELERSRAAYWRRHDAVIAYKRAYYRRPGQAEKRRVYQQRVRAVLAAARPAPPTVEERFWAKVEQSDGCWLWLGSKADGYGRFWIGRPVGLVPAHRWAYEALVDAIPVGLEIDHLCRTRACVNPTHMEPVTHRENGLRGIGPSSRARNTHCIHSHPFDEENTRWVLRLGARHRQCRTCIRARSRAYQARKKERAA